MHSLLHFYNTTRICFKITSGMTVFLRVRHCGCLSAGSCKSCLGRAALNSQDTTLGNQEGPARRWS